MTSPDATTAPAGYCGALDAPQAGLAPCAGTTVAHVRPA